MTAPLPVPGLPGSTNLGTYAGSAIGDATHKLVHAFAPMIPQVLPFAVGYMLLMVAVDWVMDHAPFIGNAGGSAGPGVTILSEGPDGMAVQYTDGYGRTVRGTQRKL